MTDERNAIQQLARCRFAPATWDKKFAVSMNSTPEAYVLTPRQRGNLWRLVVRYRRQLGDKIVQCAHDWLAVSADQRAFEDALGSNPQDWDTRRVYGDWLEERGETQLANAQRWMAEEQLAPDLRPCGAMYDGNGSHPCNYEWHFYLYDRSDKLSRQFIARCWFWSREAAERYIGESLEVVAMETAQ